MHLITRKTLRTFWQKYPDSQTALERWSRIIEKNNFDSFAQLRATFPSADLVGKLIVFNISPKGYPKGFSSCFKSRKALAASDPPNALLHRFA